MRNELNELLEKAKHVAMTRESVKRSGEALPTVIQKSKMT